MRTHDEDGNQRREICHCHPRSNENKSYKERNTMKPHSESYRGVEEVD